MGVRNVIGLERTDGTIRHIYCHWGGEPAHNGRILARHFASADRVEALLELGPLSTLGPKLAPDPGEAHTYDAPAAGVTVAYHRDRDEELPPPSETMDREALLEQECAYLFVESAGLWLVHECVEGASWRELDAEGDREPSAVRALREKLERLTGTSLRSPAEQVIEVDVPGSQRESLLAALDQLGLNAITPRQEADRFVASLPAGETREEGERRQVIASLAAARVAGAGPGVAIVRGPHRPREVQVEGDQVVSGGALDAVVHRRLLRQFHSQCPDEPHPLAGRDVVRARERRKEVPGEGAVEGPSIVGHGLRSRGDETEVEIELQFTHPGDALVRISHLARDGGGNALAWEAVDTVVDGSSRFRSRVQSRVRLPRVVDTASSAIGVQYWDVRSTVPAVGVAVEKELVWGSRDPVKGEEMTLLEWALVRGEGEDRARLNGVARFEAVSDAVIAVRVFRSSGSTVVDEDLVFAGRYVAGEVGAVGFRLRCRDLSSSDTVCVELQSLVTGRCYALEAVHRL